MADTIFTYLLEEYSEIIQMLCWFAKFNDSLNQSRDCEILNSIGYELFDKLTGILECILVNVVNEGIYQFFQMNYNAVNDWQTVILVSIGWANSQDHVHTLVHVRGQRVFVPFTQMTDKLAINWEVLFVVQKVLIRKHCFNTLVWHCVASF